MSKRANPTMIGGFVIGAVVLLVVGVMLFGGGKLFQATQDFRMYFFENVNGLSVGAPVKFKGVEVGSVVSIQLVPNPESSSGQTKDRDTPIGVVVEVSRDKLVTKSRLTGDIDVRQSVNVAINAGLRAQLQTESLVTGVLYIEFVFRDAEPPNFYEPTAFDAEIPEIPTIPSAGEQFRESAKKLMERLDKADIEGMINNIRDAAGSVNELARSAEVKDSIASLDATLKELRTAATKIDPVLESIKAVTDKAVGVEADLQATLTTAREALEKAKDVFAKLDAKIEPLVASIQAAADDAGLTMQSARQTLAPESPLIYDARTMLTQLGETLRSLQILLELLDRDPGVLLRGRAADTGGDK